MQHQLTTEERERLDELHRVREKAGLNIGLATLRWKQEVSINESVINGSMKSEREFIAEMANKYGFDPAKVNFDPETGIVEEK